MNEILTFKDLSYYYENCGKKINILNKVNCSFEKGKVYAIVGPSGCGKTTTLALAGAMDTPKGGEILYNGENIEKIGYVNYRRSKIGMVFQSYNLLNYLNALQNVLAAMEIAYNKIEDKREKAFSFLKKVGINKEEAKRNINKLSGGQQQRVAIARAISTNSDVILADEPTGNLDSETAKEIISLFSSLAHNDGKCIIVVTHSQDFAKQSDIVLKLQNGEMGVQ